MKNSKVAVLMTCHNRKEKTLNCLKWFYNASKPKDYLFDLYLVDDGSTDGTKKAIKNEFPQVNILNGNGNLFWNQGMRLAWNKAQNEDDYDFFIWLNDDVILDTMAIMELFECYKQVFLINQIPAIITGACRSSKNGSKFSYGGRTEQGEVIPNGKLQKCTYINGNVVLIPDEIFKKLGNLSNEYTHAMGDFDYGLRAIKSGFNNYTTKKYIAICSLNELPMWSSPEISLRKRLKYFFSPKGLYYKEYIAFRKKFWGTQWMLYSIKAYFRVIFPSLYYFLKRTTK